MTRGTTATVLVTYPANDAHLIAGRLARNRNDEAENRRRLHVGMWCIAASRANGISAHVDRRGRTEILCGRCGRQDVTFRLRFIRRAVRGSQPMIVCRQLGHIQDNRLGPDFLSELAIRQSRTGSFSHGDTSKRVFLRQA